MSEKPEYSEEYVKLMKYIGDTPELVSTLYDWDLLPEQVQPKTERCNMMIQFAVWYRDVFSKRIAELESELKLVKEEHAILAYRCCELESELAEAKKASDAQPPT